MNDPICAACGNKKSRHLFEANEVFCNDYTNGDVFTSEPSDHQISELLQEHHPNVYQKLIYLWKLENGHIEL